MCPRLAGRGRRRTGSPRFLPGVYQGTYIDTRRTEVEELIENIRNTPSTRPDQRRQLDLLTDLNRRHRRPAAEDDATRGAHRQSFELAYRMQMEATDAFDIEPGAAARSATLYGPGVQAPAAACIARRLVERGVRFVQLYHGDGQPWDSHDDIARAPPHARRRMRPGDRRAADRPEAARAARRDAGHLGRRVRPHAGRRAGQTASRHQRPRPQPLRLHGLAGRRRREGRPRSTARTDEFGFQAVENRVHVHDLHATILHLLGLRPREAHLPLRRPRLPPHRRARRGRQGHPLMRRSPTGPTIPRWQGPT